MACLIHVEYISNIAQLVVNAKMSIFGLQSKQKRPCPTRDQRKTSTSNSWLVRDAQSTSYHFIFHIFHMKILGLVYSSRYLDRVKQFYDLVFIYLFILYPKYSLLSQITDLNKPKFCWFYLLVRPLFVIWIQSWSIVIIQFQCLFQSS